jgi:hypothetical protein
VVQSLWDWGLVIMHAADRDAGGAAAGGSRRTTTFCVDRTDDIWADDDVIR